MYITGNTFPQVPVSTIPQTPFFVFLLVLGDPASQLMWLAPEWVELRLEWEGLLIELLCPGGSLPEMIQVQVEGSAGAGEEVGVWLEGTVREAVLVGTWGGEAVAGEGWIWRI